MLEARNDPITSFDRAEALALRAAGYLKSNRAELDRFLRCTGVSSADLFLRPPRPEHLALILDFLISSERLLLAFAHAVDLPPEAAYDARRVYAHETMPSV
jgi:hypothetical protein